MARANGRRYDSAVGDLALRDREMGRQASDRAWIWDHDAEAEATAALAGR
jgi:salicylate hydroxylase